MRALVFIDGNNFYFRLKDLAHQMGGTFRLIGFNFFSFAEHIVKPNTLVGVRYYIGALKRQTNSEKSERMYADQQRLLAKLHAQNISVILGQLIQHPDRTFHEKGVDVRLAVEMIRLARGNAYDIAYLISSDTDLVAAVEEVRSFGKKVHYVGVAKGQSFGITKAANDVVLLRPDDIRPFLPPAIEKHSV